MNTLPKGAYPIHAARLSGKKPSELILISTIGELPGETNPVVVLPLYENPSHYDWRWAIGLPAVLVFDERTKVTARVIAQTLLGNTVAWGREIYLWRADKQKGWAAVGASDGIHLFPCTVSEQHAFRGLGCC